MFKKLFLFSLTFGLLVVFSKHAFAYNEQTTHPALTDEIVSFYNTLHSDKQLTDEEREWIVKGSIQEDTPPRWINHFYDPIYKRGWTGEKAGELPSSIVRALSLIGLSPEGSLSAINWAHNGGVQNQYSRYGGNRTWEQAFNYFINKNEKEAYLTLGHILHLLEDLSVPDHTRNDTHAPLASFGDDGSPFEDYEQKWTRETIKQLNIANNLKTAGLVAPSMPSLDNYFASLAEYSNKYFFSKDTINDPKYVFPKIVREDENFGYGIDENNDEYPIVKIRIQKESNNYKLQKYYSLQNDIEHSKILDSYFSRLAPKAVLYGAGVLELFFKQIPDAQIASEFPTHLVKYDFSRITPPTISIVGEGSKLVNATKLFVSSFLYVAENGVAIISGFANKRFTRTEQIITPVVTQSEPNISKLNPDNSAKLTPTSPDNKNKSQIANVELPKTLFSKASVVENLITSKIEKTKENITNVFVSGGNSSYGGNSPTVTVSTVNTTTDTTTTTSTTATSTDSTATSTDTNNNSTSSSSLVVSEIQVGGADTGDEFIELYNMTTSAVDISSWSIQYMSNGSANVLKKNFESGNQISAKGFFLVARDKNASGTDGYIGTKTADMLHRTFSLSGTGSGGKIFIVKNAETITGETDSDIIDKLDYSFSIPSANQSLERKTLQDNQCLSAQNNGEYLGNSCDTDSNSDFEIRTSPNPQNSQSLSESRSAPTVSNFSGVWHSTSSKINLSWDIASNINYTLKEFISNVWNTIFSITATSSYQKSISELGKDYSFSLQSFDVDGLNSASSTIVVSVPASEKPTAPTDITFSYDSANAELTISWIPSTDADTAENLLTYEMKNNASDWSTPSLINGSDSARKYTAITATDGATYNIELRAKDDTDNYSSSTSASYTTPATVYYNVSATTTLGYVFAKSGALNECNEAVNAATPPTAFSLGKTFTISSIDFQRIDADRGSESSWDIYIILYETTNSNSVANSIGVPIGSRASHYDFGTPYSYSSTTQHYLGTNYSTASNGAYWGTRKVDSLSLSCNHTNVVTFNGSSTTPW